jgi:hypothetical protein
MRWDILPADGERWRKALTSLRHDVYHLPEYVAVEARRHGAEPVGVVAADRGRRWAVPLLLRPVPGTSRVDASSPYGYPGPLSNAALGDSSFFEDALLALRDSLDSMGAISCFLRLHPFLGPPLETFKRAGSLVVHGQTVVIDLGRSEEELWKGMRANHRVQIRRAHGRGVTVVEDEHWNRLAEFVSAYWATMDRVGAEAQYYLPLSYFESLHRRLDGSVHLLLVCRGDEVIAGGVYTEAGGIVQYHLGATVSEYLQLNPAKVMFDHATRWAKRRGNRWLHLGGGVGGAEDSLFHFKAGFSPLRMPFATWRLIVDRGAYLPLAPGHASGEHSSFFPAYRSTEGLPRAAE